MMTTKYTAEEISNARAFARRMIESIEFSSKAVQKSLNPFDITPIAIDMSVPLYVRRIFANVEYVECEWENAGVKHMPASLLKAFGEKCVDFKLNVTGCELLDCFPFNDLKGTPCSEKQNENVALSAMTDRDLIGCKSACKLFDGRGVHIYYDREKRLCRLGSQELRQYCLMPAIRANYNQRGINGMPSFFFDTQQQHCFITKAYCEGFEVMKFKDNDCYLSTGQKIAELFLGKNATRNAIMQMRDSSEYNIRRLEMIERKARIDESLKQYSPLLLKQSTVNHLINGDLCSAINNDRNNRKNIEVEIKSNDNDDRAIQTLGKITGDVAKLAGLFLGPLFAGNLVKNAATRISLSITAKLEAKLGVEVAEHGVALLGSMMSERGISYVAGKTASAFLELVASTVNPVLWAYDVFAITSMIWDHFDQRFGIVTSKAELDDINVKYIRKINQAISTSKEGKKLELLEVKPITVYQLIFGDFYENDSRNSMKHVDSLLHFVNVYLKALDKELDKTQKTSSQHITKSHETFIDGLLQSAGILPDYRSVNTVVCSFLLLFLPLSLPAIFSNFLAVIASIIFTIAVVLFFSLNMSEQNLFSLIEKKLSFYEKQAFDFEKSICRKIFA